MAEIVPFPSERRTHHLSRSAEGAAFNSNTVGAARNRLSAIVDKRCSRLMEIGCCESEIVKERRTYDAALTNKLFEILNQNKMLG